VFDAAGNPTWWSAQTEPRLTGGASVDWCGLVDWDHQTTSTSRWPLDRQSEAESIAEANAERPVPR
jgi:hypothetical protein